MRTWDHWQQHGNLDEPIDISDYEAVGTLRRALYLHAEEAYEETGSDRGRLIAERLFKALTDTFSDQRGVRRPTSIQELAAICQATEEEIIRVVEIFRRAGRSFLMPPTDIQLGSSSVIDISHESLMRCWDRLIGWAEQERVSANSYIRIAQAAAWFEEGAGGLWRDPELELALQWKSMNQPTVAWADRYVVSFVRAMDFLDRSKAERDRVVAEVEKERKTKLRHAQWAAAVLGLLLVVAGVFFIAERIEKKRADMNQARADMNFLLTEDAMNGMLTLAGNEPGRVSEDVPQLDQLRKQLAQKVERLYRELTKQKPDSEGLREEEAVGYVGLGDSDRLLEHDSEAVNEYKLAIDQFESLAKDAPDKPKYRQEAANAYDSLGLVLAGQKGLAADAENAYNHALNIQEELSHSDPGNTQYQQDLARSYYNRGILRFDTSRHADSESDFRKAILLLEPLGESARENVGLNPSQELARVYNNLASVLRRDKNFVEAKWFYQKALGIDERAVQRDPTNRDTKLELAWFYNNLAAMESEDMKDSEAAKQTNGHALALIEQLADPAPSLSLDLARTHDIRGLIFHGLTAKSGLPLSDVESHEYLQSMEILEKLENVAGTRDLPKFKNQVTELVNIYLYIAKEAIESGSLKDAQGPLGNVSRLLQDLPEEDQLKFAAMYHELQQSLREKTVNSR
jgi:hypothetical protein